MSPPPLPPSFVRKKQKILLALSVPVTDYDDLSPKGSIDEGIRDLIDEINTCEGFVTTSSCGGRVSVFGEGVKKASEKDVFRISQDHVEDDRAAAGGTLAGVGGKGGGGRWLFVSHDKVAVDSDQTQGGFTNLLGMASRGEIEGGITFVDERLVHFKFEPMILHVLTASLHHAQIILGAALQAGFRESGALNLVSSTSEAPIPMVAIRSMGLGLESVIGRLAPSGEGVCIVPESHLHGLLTIANDRFDENTMRINRFRALLADSLAAMRNPESKKSAEGGEWEDPNARRERKRAEGLKRSREIQNEALHASSN